MDIKGEPPDEKRPRNDRDDLKPTTGQSDGTLHLSGSGTASTQPQTTPVHRDLKIDNVIRPGTGHLNLRGHAPQVEQTNLPSPPEAEAKGAELRGDAKSSSSATGTLTDAPPAQPARKAGRTKRRAKSAAAAPLQPTPSRKDATAPGADITVNLSMEPGSAVGQVEAAPQSPAVVGELKATESPDRAFITGQVSQGPAPTVIAEISNDEASSTSRPDSLDMKADAKAFAQIAMSRTTKPPLAVGVFGHWGAGKSFFMDLVQEEIRQIATDSRDLPPNPQGESDFHDKVVRIRFNAWHYAETQLWASLVGHIFQELAAATSPDERDEVLGKLHTARKLTFEAANSLVEARREHRLARHELEGAKTDLAKAKAKPVRTVNLFADMMVSAFQDSKDGEVQAARNDIETAAQELGLGSLITSTQELTDEGAALLRNGLQARDIFWSMTKNMGSAWEVAGYVFLVLAIPLGLAALLRYGLDYVQMHGAAIAEAIAYCTTLAGALSLWVRKAAGPVLTAVQKLRAAKERLDKHVAANLKKYEDLVAANEAHLAKASASVEAASDVLKATSARLAQAREEMHGQSASNRLINFVRARASDGEYAKHLGIISTIRKDFEELSNFVSGKVKNPQGSSDRELKEIRRQIAAILRRTRRERLLTKEEVADLKLLAKGNEEKPLPFERIVLFIDDVDRCPPAKVVEVLQAVHMLLAFKLFVVFVAVDVRWLSSSLAHEYKGMLTEPDAENPLTSASDYLEKIFQIPYWVPPITAESSRKLLYSILPIADGSPTAVDAPPPVAQAAPEAVTGGVKYELVALDSTERELLAAFAGVLDSPRKVIRFANVARFLKVRGRLGSADRESRQRTARLFAQLAIATAVPEQYTPWRFALDRMKDSTLKQMRQHMDDSPLVQYPVVKTTMAILETYVDGESSAGLLVEADAWAGRLSFSQPPVDFDGKAAARFDDFEALGSGDPASAAATGSDSQA